MAITEQTTTELLDEFRDLNERADDVRCYYAGIHDNCALWNADWQCCGIQHETPDPVQTDDSMAASIVLRPLSCKDAEVKP